MTDQEMTQAADGAASEVASSASAAPARRRTARAKKEDAASASDAAQPSDSPEKPKATRGRRKKAEGAEAPAASHQDAASQDAASDESAPKKRRGRPRKAAADAADASQQDAPAQAEAAGEGSASSQDEPAAPRRRSRSRKVTVETSPSDGDAAPRPGVRSSAARQNQASGAQGGHNNQNHRDNQKQNRYAQRGDNQNHRHQRQRRGSNQREMVPSVTLDELAALKVADLRARAAELSLDATGMKKAELVQAVYGASMKAEGFIEVVGVLDILADGYGFLRTEGYLPSEHDCYVGLSTIRRNGLRKGDMVRGQTRPARENEKYAAIQKVISVNDVPVEELGNRVKFSELTPIYPDECLIMEHGKSTITARVIDLVSPIGKGQRGLIVSPPKAGKTTILKDVAAAISANNPEVHLMCLLVDERPEEVTDMQRSIKGEVISSTFDMPTENHIAVSELVIERAKRLVECGKDVVILLDSITRLARAYNLAQPASGRILSGGVDSTALYPPKRFLGAARNIEHGGSLTILASALIDTGSKMDEVIFEEFKGTGNMELKLDRNLADRRIFPAIDPVASGTRKEDLLLDPQQAPLIWAVRRILANMNNTERAMDMLIKSLKQTDTNAEFLLRTAKKAQHSKMDSVVEL